MKKYYFGKFFHKSIKESEKNIVEYVNKNKEFFENEYFANRKKIEKRIAMYSICFLNKKTKEKIEEVFFSTKFYLALKDFFDRNFEIVIKEATQVQIKALVAGGAKIYDIRSRN